MTPSSVGPWCSPGWIGVSALAFLAAVALPRPTLGDEKLRVIIETDAGGDPDDEQSLVRFLLYVNEWDVEGILCTRPKTRADNANPARTGLDVVRRLLDAYGQVYPKLSLNKPGYPTKQALWKVTVAGYDNTSDGVDRILAALDKPDPRAIWFSNWGTDDGTTSSLKRAFDRILAERGRAAYEACKQKVRLCSDEKFAPHTLTTPPNWPLWVYTKMPAMDGGRWYHRFSPLTKTAGGFNLERDVRTGHGPLGALYPTATDLPQKEGDTPEFLYLIPTGLHDPESPGQGSWAGRYSMNTTYNIPNYHWCDQRDTWEGITSRDNTLKRWAVHIQNDFAARMDWCVKDPADVNHEPIVQIKGKPAGTVLRVEAAPGATVDLTAAGTTDPDGDALHYEWVCYREAGTYEGHVAIADPAAQATRVTIPRDAAGKAIDVVLQVTDAGSPALTRYGRLVISVRAADAPPPDHRGRPENGPGPDSETQPAEP
jgi:hypothetical protein